MTAAMRSTGLWMLAERAHDRAEACGYTVEDVLQAAAYGCPVATDDGRVIREMGGCRVVVDPVRLEVMTVLDPAVGPYLPELAPPATPQAPLERFVSEQEVKSLSNRVRNSRKPSEKEKVIEGPLHCKFEFVDELPPERRGAQAAQEHWLGEVLPSLRNNPGAWAQIMEFPAPTTAAGRMKSLRVNHPGYEWTTRRWGQKAGEPGARSVIYARYPVQVKEQTA